MNMKGLRVLLSVFLLVFGESCMLMNESSGSEDSDDVEKPAQALSPVIESPRLVDDSAVKMSEKSSGYCKALVPEDWSFTSVPPYVGADAWSPDKTRHAAWGITSIFKSLFPQPDAALGYLLTAIGYDGFQLTGNGTVLGGGFILVDFSSSIGRRGQVIYKVYDIDPTFYVLSVYLGATVEEEWQSMGGEAVSAAVSIRCVSQLRPSTSNLDVEFADPSDRDDNPEVDLSEEWSEAILGFENVYSPSTGEHYLAPLETYWATGPDGGGYYREVPGGGYELLQEGFGDY